MSNSKSWHWTTDNDTTLTRMRAGGSTDKMIAAEIGCAPHQARDRAKTLKLPVREFSAPRPKVRTDPSSTAPSKFVPGDQWAGATERDARFAAAMAGRTFDALKVTPDHRKLSRRVYDAGVSASSMELNA
jgi:hypothetical protein